MKNKKDKTLTGILAFFGGGFGVHRFYLGQIGKGIAYLLFSWTFIPSIIAFFDAIGYFMMPEEKFDRIYNSDHYQPSLQKGTAPLNVADEIHKLDLLFKKGVITFEEFERRKAQLLG